MDLLGRAKNRGAALALDKAAIQAGILALDGRAAEALQLYRETLRGWQALKLVWDGEALTVVDMVTLLGPAEPDVRAAAESARATLSQLGARPYLERLEAALEGSRSPDTASRRRASSHVEAATPG